MFATVTADLLNGFGLTVLLFAVTLVAAIPLGLVVAFCSMTRFIPLKWLTKVFVWVIRGTPLMLQIIVISFIPNTLFEIPNRAIADFFGTSMANVNFIFVCVAFIINYAAYFSEIFRGGIESIPKGQHEAAQVLGMTRGQTFFLVVLPQVFRLILPPVSNETITLVKDTSLVYVLAMNDLMRTTRNLVQRDFDITPFLVAGVFYLVATLLLTMLFERLEKRFSRYDQ